MKLPRDVSGDRLIRVLESLGSTVMRQKGSHVRLKHDGPPAHSISVPRHDSFQTGTLHGILSDGAQNPSVALDVLIARH